MAALFILMQLVMAGCGKEEIPAPKINQCFLKKKMLLIDNMNNDVCMVEWQVRLHHRCC